ncbi:MAG: hypothetical protein M3530_06240 [Thermoproteota archaeon]|nr:hypothetical protein [Thermoproteota archaeon]
MILDTLGCIKIFLILQQAIAIEKKDAPESSRFMFGGRFVLPFDFSLAATFHAKAFGHWEKRARYHLNLYSGKHLVIHTSTSKRKIFDVVALAM